MDVILPANTYNLNLNPKKKIQIIAHSVLKSINGLSHEDIHKTVLEWAVPENEAQMICLKTTLQYFVEKNTKYKISKVSDIEKNTSTELMRRLSQNGAFPLFPESVAELLALVLKLEPDYKEVQNSFTYWKNYEAVKGRPKIEFQERETILRVFEPYV